MATLTFWGTRGSCAAPFNNRNRYGGNTCCVSVRNNNCWLVFDGGTGIISLAREICQAAADPNTDTCSVKILISHFHLDHIIGLPMFLAALPANVDVILYTVPEKGNRTNAPYANQLISLIGPPLWPVKLTDICSRLKLADLDLSTVNMIGDGISVSVLPSNHPDNAGIFRIKWNGMDIVYGLDCEITDHFEDTYIRFAFGCDLLIYDGTYTDEDYVHCTGFGHSTFTGAIHIAEKTCADQVYIMHYNYSYSDDLLYEIEKNITQNTDRIHFAREGQIVELTDV